MLYTVELSFLCMPCLWHTEANRTLRLKKKKEKVFDALVSLFLHRTTSQR